MAEYNKIHEEIKVALSERDLAVSEMDKSYCNDILADLREQVAK